MKKAGIFFVIIFSMLLGLPALAEDKVATVDIPRIIETIGKDSTAGKALEKRRDAEKSKLLGQKTEIEKMDAALREKGVKPDSAEAEAFRKQVREFQKRYSDTEESLSNEFMKIQKDIFERVKASVSKIAEEEGIKVVLTKSEAVPTAVLYSDRSLDLTERVLADLND
jgi:Skp family chaperone for outer membrane proteins